MSSSTTSLKPIILYASGPSPNPHKPAILLEELGLPWTYHHVNIVNGEVKAEPYISINPNGRLPSIEDPNTGIKIWESGAIIEYLIETYDQSHKFHSEEGQKKWDEKSWLFFQASGQGPYFGQKVWFDKSHFEVNHLHAPFQLCYSCSMYADGLD
jgi:glutathione S-transferase